jgi:hypothetical protein
VYASAKLSVHRGYCHEGDPNLLQFIGFWLTTPYHEWLCQWEIALVDRDSLMRVGGETGRSLTYFSI